MKTTLSFLTILTCFIFVSCTGPGEIDRPKIKSTDTYQASKNQVWEAIIAELGDMNFPIKTIEKASWLIQSDRVNISTDDIYYYCAVEGGNYKGGKLSFTFYLTGNDSASTDMKITADFEGSYISGLGQYATTEVTQLYTNGKYEKELFQSIRKRIKY